MITILPINKDIKFKYLIHLSDIHIRLLKRHDEYRQVFDTFFKNIQQYPKDETCIAIVGDLFHSKTDLQPECIDLASYFLTGCSNLFPTIIVAGNHDGTVSNKNRMDSISPIVDMINHPNLYYLKATGLYGFGNILFNNMCVFDPPEKYILGKDIPSIYKNQYQHIIALFHGPVNQSSLENGYTITNPAIMPSLFADHHLAILGDIHKSQDISIDTDEIVIPDTEIDKFDLNMWEVVEEIS